jgi:hypothetical protein
MIYATDRAGYIDVFLTLNRTDFRALPGVPVCATSALRKPASSLVDEHGAEVDDIGEGGACRLQIEVIAHDDHGKAMQASPVSFSRRSHFAELIEARE